MDTPDRASSKGDKDMITKQIEQRIAKLENLKKAVDDIVFFNCSVSEAMQSASGIEHILLMELLKTGRELQNRVVNLFTAMEGE